MAKPFKLMDPEPGEISTNDLSTSRLDAMSASMDMAFNETLIGSATRFIAPLFAGGAGDEEKIDPVTLNNMHPFLPKAFTEPLTATEAGFIVSAQERRMRAEDVISRAPRDLLQSGMNLGAAIVTDALDPSQLVLDVATGGAFAMARNIPKSIRYGRIMKGLRVGARRSKRRVGLEELPSFGTLLKETAVANTIAEPIISMAQEEDMQNYTLVDSIANVALGSFIGSGLQYGINRLAKHLKRLDDKAVDDVAMSVVSQNHYDVRPDAHLHMRQKIKEMRSDVQPYGLTEYRYVPDDVGRGKTFYIPSKYGAAAVDNIDTSNSSLFSDQFQGVEFVDGVDKASIANGDAASHYNNAGAGTVIQVRVKDAANILFADKAMTSDVKKIVTENVGQHLHAHGKQSALDGTMTDVFRALDEINMKVGQDNEEIFDRLYKGLSRRADVIHYKGNKIGGIELGDFNGYKVLNNRALRQVKVHDGDRSIVPMMSDRERLDMVDKHYNTENKVFFDPDYKKYDVDPEISAVNPHNLELVANQAEQIMDDVQRRIDNLVKQGSVKADNPLFTNLKKLDEMSKNMREAAKEMEICVVQIN